MLEIYYEDRNYPYNIYVAPDKLKKQFEKYMKEEGAALQKHFMKRFDYRYTFTYVKLGDETVCNPFKFEERNPRPIDYFGRECGYRSLHCEICADFSECPAWNR